MTASNINYQKYYRGFCARLKADPTIKFSAYCDEVGVPYLGIGECDAEFLINRAISLHRRNSLFFGSHAGAERHAIFYSLACSCRHLGINFRQYIIDTLNAAAKLPPTASADTWRNLLPDRYTKSL